MPQELRRAMGTRLHRILKHEQRGIGRATAIDHRLLEPIEIAQHRRQLLLACPALTWPLARLSLRIGPTMVDEHGR